MVQEQGYSSSCLSLGDLYVTMTVLPNLAVSLTLCTVNSQLLSSLNFTVLSRTENGHLENGLYSSCYFQHHFICPQQEFSGPNQSSQIPDCSIVEAAGSLSKVTYISITSSHFLDWSQSYQVPGPHTL